MKISRQHRRKYSNRSHKEIETVFTKFNRATYFNFTFFLGGGVFYDDEITTAWRQMS
jgi:hypothetical protein